MTYGIYDTIDHVWMGSEEGPLTHDDQEFLVLAANVLANQAGFTEAGRLEVREFDCPNPVKRDSIELHRTFDESLSRLESGRDLALVRYPK